MPRAKQKAGAVPAEEWDKRKAELWFHDPERDPDGLRVFVRMSRTSDGAAASAVYIERVDGRAIASRDLRREIHIPELTRRAGETGVTAASPEELALQIRPSRPGSDGYDLDHWRKVWDLHRVAKELAPRGAYVQWMCKQWQDTPDATMRRWVKKADQVAKEQGWAP